MDQLTIILLVYIALVATASLMVGLNIRPPQTNPSTEIDDIQNIILNYESDSFSASDLNVSQSEARLMAYLIISDVKIIVQNGGTMVCDGVWLDWLLDSVRDDDNG